MGTQGAQMPREAAVVESHALEWAQKLESMKSEFEAQELAEDAAFGNAKLAIEKSVQQERLALDSKLSHDEIQRIVDRIIALTVRLADVEKDNERSKAERREAHDKARLEHFERFSSQFPARAVTKMSQQEKLTIGRTPQQETSEPGRRHGMPQVENVVDVGPAQQSLKLPARRGRPPKAAKLPGTSSGTQPVPQSIQKGVPPTYTANSDTNRTPSTAFAEKRKAPHETNDEGSQRSDKRPRVQPDLEPTSPSPADGGRLISAARTVWYDEVYQGGKAEYKHVIIEHPVRSNQWYILKCDEHGVHFGRNPVIGGGKHLWSIQHGFASKKETVVVGLLGHLVRGCTAALADQNNKITLWAFEQGYKPFNLNSMSKSERLAHTASPSPAIAGRIEASARKKDGTSSFDTNPSQSGVSSGTVPSKPFNGVIDPTIGELYLGYWSHTKTKYGVIVLPWGDLRPVGKSGTLATTGLLSNSPRCYRVDRLTREIKGWAKGYEYGGPLATKREFPVMYFDGKHSVSWLKAKYLSPFNLEDPNSRLIPYFDVARDYYAHNIHGFRDYADMKEQGGRPAPGRLFGKEIGENDHVPISNGESDSLVGPPEARAGHSGAITTATADTPSDQQHSYHPPRPDLGQVSQGATKGPPPACREQDEEASGSSGAKQSREAIVSAPTHGIRGPVEIPETQSQEQDTEAAATATSPHPDVSVPLASPSSQEPAPSGGPEDKQDETYRETAADKAPLAHGAQAAPAGDQDSSSKAKSGPIQGLSDLNGSRNETQRKDQPKVTAEAVTPTVAALRAIQEAALRDLSLGAPEQEVPITNVSSPSVNSKLGAPDASATVGMRPAGIPPQDEPDAVPNTGRLSAPNILSASISRSDGSSEGPAPPNANAQASPDPRSDSQAPRTVATSADGTTEGVQGTPTVPGSSNVDCNLMSEKAAPDGSAPLKLIPMAKLPDHPPPYSPAKGRSPTSNARQDGESLRSTAVTTPSKPLRLSQPQPNENSPSSIVAPFPAARADIKTELSAAVLDREGYYDLPAYLDSDGNSFVRQRPEPCLRLSVNPVAGLAETEPGQPIKVTIDPHQWSTAVLVTVQNLGKTVVRLGGAENRTAELTFDESIIGGRKQSGIVQARRFIRWMRTVNPALQYKNASK